MADAFDEALMGAADALIELRELANCEIEASPQDVYPDEDGHSWVAEYRLSSDVMMFARGCVKYLLVRLNHHAADREDEYKLPADRAKFRAALRAIDPSLIPKRRGKS